MGRAVILGGGNDGRYTIEVDLGTGPRDEKAASISLHIARLDGQIATAVINAAAAQSIYDAAQADIDSFIAANASGGQLTAPGTPAGKGHEQKLRALLLSSAQLARKKSTLNNLRLQREQQQRALTALQNLPLIQQRDAWCVDLTEGGSGAVATAEIPGESDLILIKPGAPPWSPSDGVLAARELLDPAQAFFNAAILPGWQKYKPTFRRGTLLGVNKDANTATVALADHRSSAQRLPVDQQGILTNIPVTYMTCHAAVFDVGDNVVVMFDNQEQSRPRVIGFVTDPKPCAEYTMIFIFNMKYLAPPTQTQTVYEGQDADSVTAPSASGANGWLGWNDGIASYVRLDENVTANATYIAQYTKFADVVGFASSWQLYIVSSVYNIDTGLYAVTFGLTVTFSFTPASLEGPSSGLLQVMPASILFDDTTPRVEFMNPVPSTIPPNFLYSGVLPLISAAEGGNLTQTTTINSTSATVTFNRLSQSAGFNGSTSLYRAILVAPQVFV